MAETPMPTLHLYPVGDSLSRLWPELAAECGLTLSLEPEVEALERLHDGVGVICAAGSEEMLEGLVRRVETGSGGLAAVGTLPDHRLAVSLIRAGAAEYFALPQDRELLRSWLRERAERMQARVSGRAFAAGQSAQYRFEGIVGESRALRDALDRAARVIPHRNVTVLITGETGTGKELLARAIHYNGPRSEAPFVDINCAAIPDGLLESELFGHEKGAFTGAASAKPGLFEVADGGTLFLDEIAHLSVPLQGKLLRALQERLVRRVGGTRSKSVDVRILAATHVDLAGAVRHGEFREDLFHRLNVVPIELPPLRARREDIGTLARRFLQQFAAEYDLPLPVLTADAVRAMGMHPWRGNIRELRNVMERALLMGDGGVIDARTLALEPAGPRPALDRGHGIPFPSPLGDIVQAAVRDTVALCAGNKSEAARQLQISRTRLQRLLDRNGSDGFEVPNDTGDEQ